MTLRHLGIGLGRIEHWHDGLGEFSRRLGLALAERATWLREEHGVALHFHLPNRWHGEFGFHVHYLPTHTTQRWCHLTRHRFALWHTLHQHNRLKPPLGTLRRLETVHDLNFLHSKQGAKRERYRRRLGRRIAVCDTVVAITHHVAEDIRTQLTGVVTPVQVIHNGVSDLTNSVQREVIGLWQSTSDTSDTSVIGHSPFLLHVSRMAPTKNIVALLDLAAHWPQQRFVLAGADSPYTREVEHAVAQRKLDNVLIRLNLEEAEKAWLYAHCEGFVFPSLAEGFGLPPLEAMHFGKPTFLSRLTSLPEVGGNAAFYFDSFKPQAMREVIEAGVRATREAGAAERIATHARQFNWQRCADEYIALYLHMLAS